MMIRVIDMMECRMKAYRVKYDDAKLLSAFKLYVKS